MIITSMTKKGYSLHRLIRRVVALGVIGLFPLSTYAQLSKVNSELGKVHGELGQLANTVMSIVQTLAGIFAVVALVTLVVKFQEGDHEAKKKLMMWLGGLVVLFVAISIVKSLFSNSGVIM